VKEEKFSCFLNALAGRGYGCTPNQIRGVIIVSDNNSGQ